MEDENTVDPNTLLSNGVAVNIAIRLHLIDIYLLTQCMLKNHVHWSKSECSHFHPFFHITIFSQFFKTGFPCKVNLAWENGLNLLVLDITTDFSLPN